MMKLKRVGAPEISPNGKWVLFSLVTMDLSANTGSSHIWIVPTNGGSEREIVGTQDGTRPRWAPDGQRFAFLSYKEHGSQVWVADFDDAHGTVTNTHALTAIATGAAGEIWSPDGKNIVFVSNVYPECSDEACNAKKLAQAAQSKASGQIFTRLAYRYGDTYRDGKRSHLWAIAVPTRAEQYAELSQRARDLTPGDYDSPVFPLGGQDNYSISPDGRELCFTSNHDRDEQSTSTNTDLWTIPLTADPKAAPAIDGRAKNITSNNPAADSMPLYSPDGRYIAYLAQARPGYESDRLRLMIYNHETGERRNLARDLDRWVSGFTWAADSNAIYFTAEDAGQAPIYRIGLEANSVVSRIESLAGYDYVPRVSGDGKRLFYVHGSAGAPYEIYESELIKGRSNGSSHLRPQQRTHGNEALLSQLALSPLESFWFRGAHGDRVQGFLINPPDFDPHKKYPLKFLLKGGPQIAAGDNWSYIANPYLYAADGYVVATINFHGSTGYGQAFIDSVNGDWGGAPYEDQMLGLDYLEKTYPYIDKDRECAIGSSYGGYMANWILGHSQRFRCVVSHHSVFNVASTWGATDELGFFGWDFKGTPYSNPAMFQKWSPSQYATNFKTPTLVIHGQLDYRVDVSQGLQLFTALQVLGVPSKMLYFPDEAQYPAQPKNAELFYKTINDWVNQWTRPRDSHE
jgi:dipeptidyl aminopeptidase/acylaminoacyl peptidase